jgi:hypothetical protein
VRCSRWGGQTQGLLQLLFGAFEQRPLFVSTQFAGQLALRAGQ